MRMVATVGGNQKGVEYTANAVFTGPAVERLNAQPDLKEIVCTNTVPPRVAGSLDRLTVLSVAPLFAEAVRRIHSGESISSLFDA